jgi:hypothetical protein
VLIIIFERSLLEVNVPVRDAFSAYKVPSFTFIDIGAAVPSAF